MFFATTPFIVNLVMSDFSKKFLMLPIQQETHQKRTQGSCQLMRSQTDPIWSAYRVVLESNTRMALFQELGLLLPLLWSIFTWIRSTDLGKDSY